MPDGPGPVPPRRIFRGGVRRAARVHDRLYHRAGGQRPCRPRHVAPVLRHRRNGRRHPGGLLGDRRGRLRVVLRAGERHLRLGPQRLCVLRRRREDPGPHRHAVERRPGFPVLRRDNHSGQRQRARRRFAEFPRHSAIEPRRLCYGAFKRHGHERRAVVLLRIRGGQVRLHPRRPDRRLRSRSPRRAHRPAGNAPFLHRVYQRLGRQRALLTRRRKNRPPERRRPCQRHRGNHLGRRQVVPRHLFRRSRLYPRRPDQPLIPSNRRAHGLSLYRNAAVLCRPGRKGQLQRPPPTRPRSRCIVPGKHRGRAGGVFAVPGRGRRRMVSYTDRRFPHGLYPGGAGHTGGRRGADRPGGLHGD